MRLLQGPACLLLVGEGLAWQALAHGCRSLQLAAVAHGALPPTIPLPACPQPT